MAFTPFLIGSKIDSNAAALSITVPPGGVPAGDQIFLAMVSSGIAISDTSPSDTAGNVYNQEAGALTPDNSAQVRLFNVASTLSLALGNTIGIVFPTALWSGRALAFGAAGLSQGAISGTSAGEDVGTHPLAVLPSVPANDWCIGICGVAGPSTDGYTQDPNYSNLGNLNTQSTPSYSLYMGYTQSVSGGKVSFAPTLGVSRPFVCLLISLTP